MLIVLCGRVDDRLKYFIWIFSSSSITIYWHIPSSFFLSLSRGCWYMLYYFVFFFFSTNNKGIFTLHLDGFFFHLLASVYHVSYIRPTVRKREKERERGREREEKISQCMRYTLMSIMCSVWQYNTWEIKSKMTDEVS
jgi:hypothetical protein